MNSGELSIAPPAQLQPRRLLSRVRLEKLARFASAQVLVQVIGFLAGLVLVRTMDQASYGHYTLAMTMVGLAAILLDLGLMTAVVAVGGPLHAQPPPLAALLGDAWRLQKRLLLMLLVLVPAFLALFLGQGLAAVSVAVLLALVFAGAGLQNRNNMVLAVVRLRGNLGLQQRLEIGTSLIKLALVGVASAVLLDVHVAMAINVLSAAMMFLILRRHLARDVGAAWIGSGEYSPALRRMVWMQAPNAVYQCISGQMAVWLVGLFGTTHGVAEVGALGRLALFFSLIGAVVTALIQPYFARAQHHRDMVSAFWATNLFFALLTALLVGAALWQPGALLWILGPKYAGLAVELVWMVLSACLASWAGAAYAMGAARGWVLPGSLAIPAGVVALALSAWLLDVSTVAGSFMLNTATAAVSVFLSVGYVCLRLRRQHLDSGLPT